MGVAAPDYRTPRSLHPSGAVLWAIVSPTFVTHTLTLN